MDQTAEAIGGILDLIAHMTAEQRECFSVFLAKYVHMSALVKAEIFPIIANGTREEILNALGMEEYI